MSLIHEALKKAEKKPAEEQKIPKGAMPSFDPVEKKTLNVRTIALIVVLVVVIVIALVIRLSGRSNKKEIVPEGQVAPQVTASQMSQAEVKRLKKSADDSFASGDMNQTWAILTAANQIKADDPEVLNNLGLVAKRRGELETAKEYYSSALKIKPDYPECLNNRAVVEMEEGNYAKAKLNLARALALTPTFADASFNMALVHEREGNPKEAVKYYMQFLKHAQDVKPTFLEEVRNHVIQIEE